MEPLYHETNRVIQEIQQCFQQLNVPQTNSVSVENQILVKIATVNALVVPILLPIPLRHVLL